MSTQGATARDRRECTCDAQHARRPLSGRTCTCQAGCRRRPRDATQGLGSNSSRERPVAAQNAQAEYRGALGGEDRRRDWRLDWCRLRAGRAGTMPADKTFARLRQGNRDTPLGQARSSLLATVSRTFLPDARTTSAEYDFFHGWEVLQQLVEGYDTALRFRQRDHNVKNIATALTQSMGVDTMNPAPTWGYAMESLASYVLLDGIIGNTDRHHENWMIAWVHDRSDMAIEIMPSFDHASSLGRELTDDRRRQLLETNRVSRYVQRGRGGVYVGDGCRRAPSPLRLARLLCRWRPTLTRKTLDRIDGLSEPDVRKAVGRVPSEFMSDTSKEFACQVVLTSKRELLRGTQ